MTRSTGSKPSQHLYAFFDGPHEVAGEIEVQDILNPEYEQPQHPGPYAVIHFFEVSEEHRRKGYGTEAVLLIVDRYRWWPSPRTPISSGHPWAGNDTSTPRSRKITARCLWARPVPGLPAPAPSSEMDGTNRSAVVLKMTTAGLVTLAMIFLLMTTASATAAVLHLPGLLAGQQHSSQPVRRSADPARSRGQRNTYADNSG